MAQKCQSCNNQTNNPSGFCYLHESRRSAAPGAKSVGAPKPSPTTSQKSEMVTLSLDQGFEEVTVKNGDLSDPEIRGYFSDGLCGDLANEIHKANGAKVYLALDIGANSDGSLPPEADMSGLQSIDDLQPFVFHAVAESKSNPGMFVDSYGLKSREEIEGHFGGILVEAPEHIHSDFHSGEDHDVSAFAESAIRMEEEGLSEPYPVE